MTRAAGHDRNTGLPCEPGPAVGHMRGSRFVANVDQVKTLAVAHAEKLVEVVTDQGKQVGDAEVLKGRDEEFCAIGHRKLLV